MERLALSRYQFGVALEQAAQPEPANALAITGLHDAVELFLHLGAEIHDVEIPLKLRPALPDYFGLLRTADPPVELTQRNAMNRLNAARIALKHHGTRPAAGEVLGFCTSVTRFFTENTPRLFGLKFDQIAMSLLIADDQARAHLEAAERDLTTGDLDAAVTSSAIAFAYLMRRYHGAEHRVRVDAARLTFLRQSQDFDLRDVAKVVEQLAAAVDLLERRTEHLSLNVAPARAGRFHALTPDVAIAMAGNPTIASRPRSTPASGDDARFCIQFVVDVALALQRRGIFA